MRKKICIALMTAFTVLLGVSSYFIIDHYREAEHQEQMYDSLVQLVEDSETEPAEPIIYSEDKTILPELTELYRQNNDLVGWICVEDTNINYPVMQTVDNPNYYLKRGFDTLSEATSTWKAEEIFRKLKFLFVISEKSSQLVSREQNTN